MLQRYSCSTIILGLSELISQHHILRSTCDFKVARFLLLGIVQPTDYAAARQPSNSGGGVDKLPSHLAARRVSLSNDSVSNWRRVGVHYDYYYRLRLYLSWHPGVC